MNDITVNCCCSEKQTYAYVYQKDGQYEITLCNLFWQASTSGFDSQSGVFIHEMAHEVNNKIDDKEVAGHSPYGVNNALFYAEKFPWTAVYNADNYTYFAEACR